MPSTRGTCTTGLQVIGLGLPRTSTSSLQAALEQLGYNPCYHTLTDLVTDVQVQGPLWKMALQEQDKAKRHKLLLSIVKDYAAVVDGPGCYFIRDWLELFPDAKFVLGLRTSPQVWLNSIEASFGQIFGKPLLYYVGYWMMALRGGFIMNNLWEERTKKEFGVSVKTTQYYDFHNDQVRRLVPKERLLEFKATDGWVPLCEFLGKETPEGSFPHKNDAKSLNQLINTYVVWGIGLWVIIGALAGVAGWGAVWGARKLLGF